MYPWSVYRGLRIVVGVSYASVVCPNLLQVMHDAVVSIRPTTMHTSCCATAAEEPVDCMADPHE